ncbi:hypothetical protein BN946_scf184888.g8 [Trametes cinnabarina]|uniref:Uncharacterized protein n=1 Tax=Pycnoporus cinnabarinus TaxID=5643 RepID=A0A060SU20_PYCCI|nr:hypothetical protein BN946_scf184888.g8 [Trametes cinnabarina]
MWLLCTRTAKLEYFNGPHDVKGGYAILSHVWDGTNEQSFEQLQALHSKPFVINRTEPRIHEKIRRCCELAKSHRYDWLWIDTCCINRSSSAELSEAINSMFEWYKLADVCYAYLQDVPSDQDPHREDSAFRRSKWFRRGWTLQELIAPRDLVFVARDWEVIGTKASLAPLVERITGVDTDVLTFRCQPGDVSVARRMWWASARRTTRVEDQAYCLMGIFDVQLAIIYGGTQQAFLRLQEEILKHTSDQTLFAWGNTLPRGASPVRERRSHDEHRDSRHIFAQSPADFAQSGDMTQVNIQDAAQNAIESFGIPKAMLHDPKTAIAKSESTASDVNLRLPIPDFRVTSYGVRSDMLVLEASVHKTSVIIAVLACKDASTNSFVGLLLQRSNDLGGETHWKRYDVGITACKKHSSKRLRYRLAVLKMEDAKHMLSVDKGGISARCERLYLSVRPSSRSPHPRAPGDVFRFTFSRYLMAELKKQRFKPAVAFPDMPLDSPLQVQQGSIVTFTFTHQDLPQAFRIYVGLCGHVPWATASLISLRPHTPRLKTCTEFNVNYVVPPGSPPQHRPSRERYYYTSDPYDCEPDAVTRWSNSTRIFGDFKRNFVQLTLIRNNKTRCHLLDVRVGGSVLREVVGCHKLHSRRLFTLARALLPVSPRL